MKKTKRASIFDQNCYFSHSDRCIDLAARPAGPALLCGTGPDALQSQVDQQTQYNVELQDDIDNRDDPDVVLEVAKERLGLVTKDEVIFYDTTN